MINEPACPILLVEDDERLALMIRDFLTPEGFDVTVEGRGDAAVTIILNDSPEAVILDVNLPGMDGISVCRTVRSGYSGPILILTARGDEVDEIICLEVGADDFMAKPVRPRVLLARLRAHLRKAVVTESLLPQKMEVGPLLIDAGRRTLEVDGVAVDLTTAEFDLLWHLAENVGKVLSREDIYQHIHGFRYDGLDRSIDLRISRLRKKIGDDPSCPLRIKSIRGVGYLLANDS
jgi:DNA-binding response OmpR family regulator